MHSGRKIVLVGGGHAHVEVVRRWRATPSAAQVTLISPHQHTSYSGMMPGLIAGHYRWNECHIDLARLCGRDVRRVSASALHIDSQRRMVCTDVAGEFPYDLLSIDVGSTSSIDSITGARSVGVRVKPVEPFLREMERVLAQSAGLRIAVVGGGAAGIELCLAVAFRARQSGNDIDVHLVSAAARMLDNLGIVARSLVAAHLRRRAIRVHLGKEVIAAKSERLQFRDGGTLEFDVVLWATGADAPPWIEQSGFAVDGRGFMRVDKHLRSISHSDVFAAGDVVSLPSMNVPKSGVYAVRQGPVLAENLLRFLTGRDLLEYVPQRRTLALISTGGRHAVASWGPLAIAGKWVWRWKDSIDRQFMRRYRGDVTSGS